jgi:hypothetical protein
MCLCPATSSRHAAPLDEICSACWSTPPSVQLKRPALLFATGVKADAACSQPSRSVW